MTDWNIKGIAEEVIKEMREDDAEIDDIDYYIRHIAYLSVFSREPDEAQRVADEVEEKVFEMYEEVS